MIIWESDKGNLVVRLHPVKMLIYRAQGPTLAQLQLWSLIQLKKGNQFELWLLPV